jgi:hypothetical protein
MQNRQLPRNYVIGPWFTITGDARRFEAAGVAVGRGDDSYDVAQSRRTQAPMRQRMRNQFRRTGRRKACSALRHSLTMATCGQCPTAEFLRRSAEHIASLGAFAEEVLS